MSALTVAWFLLAFICIIYAARVAIADLRSSASGETSWGECCLDSRDGLACDCLPLPEQRQPERLSGRY